MFFRWGPTGQLDTICNVKTQVIREQMCKITIFDKKHVIFWTLLNASSKKNSENDCNNDDTNAGVWARHIRVGAGKCCEQVPPPHHDQGGKNRISFYNPWNQFSYSLKSVLKILDINFHLYFFKYCLRRPQKPALEMLLQQIEQVRFIQNKIIWGL